MREQAFTDRFRALFRQTLEFLQTQYGSERGSDDGDGAGTGTASGAHERLQKFNDEVRRGDIVRMVQLFPALLEDVVVTESRGLCDPSGTAQVRLIVYERRVWYLVVSVVRLASQIDDFG